MFIVVECGYYFGDVVFDIVEYDYCWGDFFFDDFEVVLFVVVIFFGCFK